MRLSRLATLGAFGLALLASPGSSTAPRAGSAAETGATPSLLGRRILAPFGLVRFLLHGTSLAREFALAARAILQTSRNIWRDQECHCTSTSARSAASGAGLSGTVSGLLRLWE